MTFKFDFTQVSDEIRLKVLELLDSDSHEAYKEIENLLGWESDGMCLPLSFIAKKINVPPSKIYYICNRKRRKKEEKIQRIAKIKSLSIKFINYHSELFHFSISMPYDWSIDKETWVDPYEGKDPNKIIAIVNSELPEDKHIQGIVPINRIKKRELLNLLQLTKFIKGMFRSSLNTENISPAIEVVILSFDEPIDPYKIYILSKPPLSICQSGSRPKNGILIDGLQGIKYYITIEGKDEQGKPIGQRIINVYITDKLSGWILSCSCLFQSYLEFKPIFERMIYSFNRDK
jgi:hypothetical protein